MLSVIVPVYNVEKYLHRCVDSILKQTYPDFELILVDDGSPDQCPQICDEYARKDPRVKVIHKPNGGLVSARNAGILASRGDYICYVDSDDWADENMLQFVHDTLAKSPVPLDMVLFAAHDVFKDHMGETVNHVPEGYYDRERLEKEVFPRLIVDDRNGLYAGCIQAHTWDKACRRELQVKCYTRDERIRVFTDVPMTYECLLNCQNIYVCNQHLYYYNRTNEGSIRAKSKENLLTKSFYYLTDYMQQHMRGVSPAIDRQLNEFPVALIIRTGKWHAKSAPSFREAVRRMKGVLQESDLLSLVSVKGLPLIPKILILLFKLRLYSFTMLLFAVKVRMEAAKS
ncbi:MAG: glycosyltransferase [Clostridia bacterium]|nr:glycosyltransferase [Clostridia bacterium]